MAKDSNDSSASRPGAFRRFCLRTFAMASKEILHIRRDVRTLFLALGMPVLLLMLFGYGVRFDIDHLPLAIVDADRSQSSRDLVTSLVASNEFTEVVTLESTEDAESAFRAGEVVAVVVVPHGLQESLEANETVGLQLLVDGSDAMVANQVLTKAESMVRAHSRTLLSLRLQAVEPPLGVDVWTRFNPTGSSAIFMVPGLAAYLIAVSAVLLTCLTVAGEWERGSMEQLFASPVGRLEIVVGKLLPYLALGFLELLLVLAFGAFAFEVPFRGSPIALFSVGTFFLVGMLGQGLLISVITKNQLVATQAGALSALLPSMLLSGMLFPIENMPTVLQWLSSIIPARYFVHTLRGVLLKGNGLDVLWPDLVAVIAFAIVVVLLATARFPRRLA